MQTSNVYEEYERLHKEADAIWQSFLQTVVVEGIKTEDIMKHSDFQPAIDAQNKANVFYDQHIRRQGV